MMRIDILTLFPQMFVGPFSQSIVKRAVDRKLVEIQILNIRDYTHDPHRVVDDYPYGGGTGMVLKPEAIFEAVEAAATPAQEGSSATVILLTPQGRLLRHQIAQELAKKDHLILICGHYEGVD
jgi:tRNA (guanine37-N1)-methyltransferase